jgi:hypothetical protein
MRAAWIRENPRPVKTEEDPRESASRETEEVRANPRPVIPERRGIRVSPLGRSSRRRRARTDLGRRQGHNVPTHMGWIRTGRTLCVENTHDLAVVGLVNAGQAAAGEEPAGEPSQYAHAVPLDSQTIDSV